MPNIKKPEQKEPSPQLIRIRQKDLFRKQTKYWRKKYGLIIETEEEYKEIAPHTKELKKVLHIIPLIKKLRFENEIS
jgi:hypothetical protein